MYILENVKVFNLYKAPLVKFRKCGSSPYTPELSPNCERLFIEKLNKERRHYTLYSNHDSDFEFILNVLNLFKSTKSIKIY